MSEENQKRLYKLFLDTDRPARAAEIAERYPHFVEAPKIEKAKKSK